MSEHPSDRWRDVEHLYHQALELGVSERAAFLAEIGDRDDGLRRDVQSLLDHEAAAAHFLEGSAFVLAARDLADSRRTRLEGRQVGGYAIVTMIGAGGMGEVYRARDSRLDRDVAVKVLDPSIAADPAYRRRFEDEARAASALNHPNIVTIYGVGEGTGDEDLAFIAMELVEGQTLREFMSVSPMPVGTALDVGVQLAAALAAAHARGIVHRDLKPENVMVRPDRLVKVLDFGIARRDGGLGEEGSIVGTLGYMSPEQAAGRPTSFASDQFSFGAILYEMLSGSRAFHRDSRVETLAAIIEAQPQPVESLNPRVPASVRRVLERCLAKDPAARYSDTAELESALRRISTRLSVGLTRRQAVWLGSATAAAAVAGVSAWFLWPPQSIAVLPFLNASTSPDGDYLCIGITEALIGRLRHLPIRVKSFSLVSNFVDTSTDTRVIGRQLGVETVLTGKLTLDAGRLRIVAELIDVATGKSLWKKGYDRGTADIFALWDEVASAIVDEGLHLRLTRDERLQLLSRPTDDAEAYDLFLRARPFQMAGSEQDYLAARELLTGAVARDPRFAEAWVALAGTYWTCALDSFIRPAEATPQIAQSLARASVLNPALPDLHFGLAITHFFFEWDWTSAEREFHLTSAAADRELQPELLLTHAMERWAMGHVDEALQIVRRARRIDPLSTIFVNAEANYLFHAGHLDEAAALYLTLINTHADMASPRFGLAEVRQAQGRFDEAIAARAQAHELEGDDRDEELRSLMSTARGEQGYRQLDRAALLNVELPRLERRAVTGGYASPLDFARLWARLGDGERAFRFLSAAFDDRAPALVFLNADRAWDAVRADPRFREAVTRVGLQPRGQG